MGPDHRPTPSGLPKLHLVGVVDVRPEAAEPFAAEHGLPLSSSLEAALADPGIQAVILATPHSLHKDQVLAAAAAGKHVFCEKPLALRSPTPGRWCTRVTSAASCSGSATSAASSRR